MPKYEVTIMRQVAEHMTLLIEADSEKQAKLVAKAVHYDGDDDFRWRMDEASSQFDVEEACSWVAKREADYKAEDFDHETLAEWDEEEDADEEA